MRITRGDATRAELAAEFGVTLGWINKVFRRVSDALRPELMDSIRRIRVKHSERLEMLFVEGMRAWQRSIGEKVTVTTTEKVDGRERTIRVEHHAGDPRFLSIMLQILEREAKLLGVDANQEDGPKPSDFMGKSRIERLRTALQRAEEEQQKRIEGN